MPQDAVQLETNEDRAEAVLPVEPEPLTLERIEDMRGWSDEEYATFRIPDVVENIRRRLESRLPQGSFFSFTSLQREALTTEGFWTCWDESPSEASHLIIQGSTSSGKTLVSELAILDVLRQEKKAIVLVPLRAMVHERTMQFKQDMDCEHPYGVYGSSADYMDNDERIIAGEYDVAVIVYEKFFAMLSSPDCHVLDDCQLVVVDELSMLSKEDRGPKLEISLEIVVNRCPTARIMCLVTSDCKTSLVAKWLHAPIIIRNPSRPVGLDEYVVRTDGHYYHRHIPGENEGIDHVTEELVTEDEGVIDIKGYNPEERVRQQKRRTLLSILERVRGEHPQSSQPRILVFVAGKADTANTAEFIRDHATDLYPRVGISESMRTRLASFEHDEDREDLEKNLLPFGIAYHHAGISTSLRECIEEEFQRNDSALKLIVATETLTIGVNMPFDVMIMMDNVVPSGVRETHTLTYQEYRNYIGRAGRLGQTNRCGSSYLIAADNQTQSAYWFQYRKMIRTGGEEIESALKEADLETKAPFLLPLAFDEVGRDELPLGKFDKILDRLYRRGFAYACGAEKLKSEEAHEEFVKYKLCKLEEVPEEFDEESTISFTELGEKAAPFGLRLSTYKLINNYFIRNTQYGLPHSATPKDITEDRYLLEILYHLCRHEEIEKCGNIAMPERRDLVALIADVIPKRIRSLIADGDGLWALPDHPFGSVRELDGSRDLATDVQSPRPKLQAAMRAVVLYWWTKGESINSIIKRTGLKGIRINNGDVERLASVVSYHLDAIYHMLELSTLSIDKETRQQLYRLQARIKYGMSWSGIPLANKHVHGLDRPRIIRFVYLCEEREVSPLDALFTMSDEAIEREHLFTREQAQLLRQRNASRRSGSHFETILEGAAKSESPLSQEQMRCLVGIRNSTTIDVLEYLSDLMFADFDNIPVPHTHWVSRENCVIELSTNRGRRILIGAWSKQTSDEVGRVLEEKKHDSRYATCCVVDSLADETVDLTCDLVLTKEFFDLLVVKSFASWGNGIHAFVSFLLDAHGTFSKRDWNNMSISDYFPRQECTKPVLRFLAHQEDDKSIKAFSIASIKNAMKASDDLHEFEAMTFGSLDIDDPSLTKIPLVVCATVRDIVRSSDLTQLLYRMSQNRFANCLVLVPGDEEVERWRSGDCAYDTDPHCPSWYGALSSIPAHALRAVRDKDEAIAAIREHVGLQRCEGFLVGVSFARYGSEKQDGDAEQLRKLIDCLAAKVGRHRILYCEYEEHHALFQGKDARPQSLDRYKECSLYIVLDNQFTKQSENCKKEREVIDERCLSGEASCLYIGGRISGGIASEDDYVTPISIDSDEFVQLALDKLGLQAENQ